MNLHKIVNHKKKWRWVKDEPHKIKLYRKRMAHTSCERERNTAIIQNTVFGMDKWVADT